MTTMRNLSIRLLRTVKRKWKRKRTRVVVFAPNAWFPSMLSGPAIVAKTLSERGYAVELVSCAAKRLTCTVMDGMAPLEERPVRRFCEECSVRSREYLTTYGLTQLLDVDFLNETDLKHLCDASASIGPDPRSFVWNGIQIGTLAAGNLSAITKRDIFAEINAEFRDRLRIMVEDGLRWYFIAEKIYAQRKPSYFVYYAEYYPEIIVGLIMQRYGVRVTPIVHTTLCGNDFRKIQVLNEMPQVLDMARRLPTWPNWRNLSLTPNQLHDVCNDVLTRLLGKSTQIFSPALNHADEFGELVARLDPQLKTLVIFTSSDDEVNNIKKQRQIFGVPVAGPKDIFADQCEFLREIAQFVSNTGNFQLIVRLHPRLGANRRSNGVADYADQVDAVARFGCSRIQVVMPESKCSSYDIAQRADLVLTSWSNIGLECVRMGLPVMMAFRGVDIYPTDDFLNYTTDRSVFFARLREGIKVELDDMLQAFRFTNMYLCATSLNFGDIVTSVDDPTIPPFSMPSCADELEDFVLGYGVVQDRRLAQQKALQGAGAIRDERIALAVALRRIIHALVFSEDGAPAGISITSSPSQDRNHLFIELEGDDLVVTYGSRRVRSASKSVRRLAEAHAELETSLM